MRDIKVTRSSDGHEYYDIYEFEGWSLIEWRTPREIVVVSPIGQLIKTTEWTNGVVYGKHIPCGAMISVNTWKKVQCTKCKKNASRAICSNLRDALEFLTKELASDE